MPPQLTRLATPARGPSLKDIDPSRLVATSSILHVSASSSSSGVSSPSSEPLELNFEDRSSSTLKLSHAATGRSFEVSLKDGAVLAQQLTSDGGAEVGEQGNEMGESEEEEEDDASEDAHICEAILRSVLAPSVPIRSIQDRIADAEMVKGAFGMEDESTVRTVMNRAQKGAQYRLAELRVRYEELERDELQSVHPAKFESPQQYEAWKEAELQELSTLISKLGSLPAFSGSVRVTVLTIDIMQPQEVSCMKCSRHPQQLKVYASVTVLPARTSSKICSTGEVFSDVKEPSSQFLTAALPTTGPTKFNETSPWIPISSVQDKVLVEVWHQQEGTKKHRQRLKFRSLSRSSKSLKVAPWNSDAFLGQVILTFDHIESQALGAGMMQAVAAPVSYMLTDEKGRQKGSQIHLQFQCSAERLYRDVPANTLLLRPPVSDLEKAFDTLVAVGLRSQKAGVFDLEPQWRYVARTFRLYYRLREQRCRLGVVNNFAHLFQGDSCYLAVIVDEWLPVCEAAREGQLTKDELTLHSVTVSLLIKPAIHAIENFQAVFPKNQPPGALSNLLKLLGLVLRWDPDPREILIPLRSWIKNAFEKRFHHHLFGLRPSVEQPTKITGQTLTNVVKLVRCDLEELGCFADAFPGSICLPGIAVPAYYKLVSAYVMNAIRAAQLKVFTKDYEDLVAELLLLHDDISRTGQQCELLDLHGIFAKHVTQLVDAARARMVDWVTSSVTSEKWEPLSPQSGALFSFSVVDLYFMIGEVMDEMMGTLMTVPFGKDHSSLVEEAIYTAVKTYVEVLEKLCLREISEENSKDSLCISKAICVKLNNMNAVLDQQHDLEKKLDETMQNGEHSKTEQEGEHGDGDAAKLNLFTIVERHSSMKEGLSSKFREIQQFTLQMIGNLSESVVYSMQGRIAVELHPVLQDTQATSEASLDQQLQPLTSYLDSHLIMMNDFLHPSLFKRMIKDICKGVIFCMEEYALNRDEDPNPMTPAQREKLEECLSFFYDYFNGDGLGLDNAQMDDIAARCRSILCCWDLDTRQLCALYWQEWDRFNDTEESGTVSSSRLHLLDYLSILRQRTDDEAREIVDQQRFIATSRMMQFMFGLPKEEELLASYPCRNSQNAQGSLYITRKHICFKDTKSALADSKMIYVVPIDRLMRIELPRRGSIVLVPFHQRPVGFSKLANREAVCRTIFSQVVGSGSHLEKSMAPIWSDEGLQNSLEPRAIKVFKCWRQSMIHKYSGTLLVSAAYILFTQDDKQKVIQMDHTNIARIHAERRGLRTSGVVVQLKNGDEFEFCDFQAVNMSNKEIAKQLHKLVCGGSHQ